MAFKILEKTNTKKPLAVLAKRISANFNKPAAKVLKNLVDCGTLLNEQSIITASNYLEALDKVIGINLTAVTDDTFTVKLNGTTVTMVSVSGNGAMTYYGFDDIGYVYSNSMHILDTTPHSVERQLRDLVHFKVIKIQQLANKYNLPVMICDCFLRMMARAIVGNTKKLVVKEDAGVLAIKDNYCTAVLRLDTGEFTVSELIGIKCDIAIHAGNIKDLCSYDTTVLRALANGSN